jgi:hypothetical protein
MSLDELKLRIGHAIGGYFDKAEVPDPEKCKQISREAMLLAAHMHVAHNGSDESFIRMACSAIEGAEMVAARKQ